MRAGRVAECLGVGPAEAGGVTWEQPRTDRSPRLAERYKTRCTLELGERENRNADFGLGTLRTPEGRSPCPVLGDSRRPQEAAFPAEGVAVRAVVAVEGVGKRQSRGQKLSVPGPAAALPVGSCSSGMNSKETEAAGSGAGSERGGRGEQREGPLGEPACCPPPLACL